MLKFDYKRFSTDMLVYGVGNIIQKFIGLLLLPFFTRFLHTEDYGIMALLTLMSSLVGGFFSLGTGSSMSILYFSESDLSKRPSVVWTNIFLLLANSFLLLSIIYLCAPFISQLVYQTSIYSNYIRLSFLALAIANVTNPFYSYLQMERKAKKYVLFSLINIIISVVLSAFFVIWMKLGLIGLILPTVISQGLMLFIIPIFSTLKFPIKIDFKLVRPLISIGFPSILGVFAFFFIDTADRQLLQRMVGLNELGIYSVGYGFGTMMMIFVGAFSSAWPPFFLEYVNKRLEAKNVFGQILKYYIILFGFLTLLFFVVAKPFTSLVVGPAFQDAYLVVGLVAAAYMLKGCYLILLPGIYFAKKLHIQSAIEWSAGFINIGLNLLWIPMFGIVGSAAATLVSYLVLPILTWIFGRRYLAVDYEWKKIIMSVLVISFACSILFWVSIFFELTYIYLCSIVIILFFILFIYFIIFNFAERKLMSEKLLSCRK